MVRYELKKVLSKVSSMVALLILMGFVCMSCWMNFNAVEWVNEQGQIETGIDAVQKLKAARKAWAGTLDEEKLAAILVDNQRIEATPEAQSRDYTQNDIAYGWRQGYRPVLDMVNYAYSEDFRSYDYYTSTRIQPSEAGRFYSNRVLLLKNWLNDKTDSAYETYTDAEKAYLVAQYEALETPILYDYAEGWDYLLYNSPNIIMIGAMVIAYLVSGIFSNEFRWKSDSLFFSSLYGRSKAIAAKAKAGFLIVTVLYWVPILIYMMVTLCFLGADGANCPIQLSQWKCIYNLTYWQAWVLTVVGGYIGNLFFAFLTMWVSAKTRSSVLAVTVPFILILLPNFGVGLFSSKLSGLLPDQLLQISQVMRYVNVYEIGSKVFGAMAILPVLYAVLSAVLVPIMYREFQRKQIV